ACDTTTAPSAGSSASSATRAQGSSSTTRAPSPSRRMSVIHRLLEGLRADPAVGVEEALLRRAPEREVGEHHALHGGPDLVHRQGAPEHPPERRVEARAPAEHQLVVLLALLVDP